MPKWIEVQSSQTKDIETIGKSLGLHALAAEDCINRDQRPKLEDYGTHQFLVWFMIYNSELYEIQFAIFSDTILVVPHELPPRGATWKEFLNVSDQHIDTRHMLYMALDRITDVSWSEVKRLFMEAEALEEKVFSAEYDPRVILDLKKRLLLIDYSMGHLPSLVKQLQNFFQPTDDLNWKFRDLHDHCERIYRSISLYRSQIATTIELFWGFQAHKTNTHIKKLSLLASIAVPMTFWASFWGMNFESIPFRSEALFISAIAVMVGSVVLSTWYLKRKGYWND